MIAISKNQCSTIIQYLTNFRNIKFNNVVDDIKGRNYDTIYFFLCVALFFALLPSSWLNLILLVWLCVIYRRELYGLTIWYFNDNLYYLYSAYYHAQCCNAPQHDELYGELHDKSSKDLLFTGFEDEWMSYNNAPFIYKFFYRAKMWLN